MPSDGQGADDVVQGAHLLAQVEPDAVVADKAYNACNAVALLDCIAGKCAKAVIPPKANRTVQRPFDRYHYRNRNVMERLFAQLKQFRRVATRYDRMVSRFKSFVLIAASVLWRK